MQRSHCCGCCGSRGWLRRVLAAAAPLRTPRSRAPARTHTRHQHVRTSAHAPHLRRLRLPRRLRARPALPLSPQPSEHRPVAHCAAAPHALKQQCSSGPAALVRL